MIQVSDVEILFAIGFVLLCIIVAQNINVQRKLDRLIALVQTEGVQIMAALDDLTAQVTANTDAEASAIQLIQNIADALKNAGNDPAKLQALQSKLKNSADALAAAILANTPAEPTP